MSDQAQVRTLLTDEHAKLDRLFVQMLEAFRADARDDAAKLWSEFDTLFSAHLEREEQFMLPRLALTHPDDAAALKKDHDELRKKLVVLGVGVDLHLTKADAVAEFVAALRAHAAREDALLYPWAEEQVKGEPDFGLKLIHFRM